ncbi:MAG: UDP-glucose 4-epimerase GalE [Deltaproteobacteria bacterium]|nr:UDP-glucose 4-epimerase GalE [Deltaproteobacteria bacterium]
MKEYILVTGGAGYIGSHTVKYLASQGKPTIVFDNLTYGHREFINWSDDFIPADLADRTTLERVFTDYNIQAVMHFAAYTYVGESVTDPARYYRNNVIGALNLLDAMRSAGVKMLVFSSTCATYGMPQEIPISESHPQEPINPYGMTKLIIERMLADYERAYGLSWCALRYFNAAGADPEGEIGEWHDPETHLIPLVLDAAIGKRPAISVFGTDYSTPDRTCIRDYIHVTDLAQAHYLALEYLQSGGTSGAFNLGNGHGHSVKEIIECVHSVTGRDIPVTYEARRAGDPHVLVGSADKAREVLGWKPHYADIDTIVKTAWNWHRKLWK